MTTVDLQTVRMRAEAVVEDVARKLTDPVSVMAQMVERSPHRWVPLSLNDGYPATALLFAELACADSAYRTIAHRHLAMGAQGQPGVRGLYLGRARWPLPRRDPCASPVTMPVCCPLWPVGGVDRRGVRLPR